MSNDLIAMDNSIVTSAYNLTLNEQRLIYCALKQMPKYDPNNPNQEPLDPRTPFYITRDDFIELGVNPDNVAQEIRQATKELMKKPYLCKPLLVSSSFIGCPKCYAMTAMPSKTKRKIPKSR